MKRVIKRALCLLLALVLLGGLVPGQLVPRAAAADEIPIDAAHFPDENFRGYVLQFDTDESGSLSTAERESVE